MTDLFFFFGGAGLLLVVATVLRAALVASRSSPESIRRSAFNYALAQINKAGPYWLAADSTIIEAIVEDAAFVATRAGRTDMVIVDEHIQRLVRIAAQTRSGLAEGSLEHRLWMRVLDRAARRVGR